MKKTILIIVILLIIGGGFYYYKGSGSTYNNTYQTPVDNTQTTQPVSVTSTPASTSTDVSVNIQGFAFSPSSTTVKKGTKVIWTNNDNVSHTVTSDAGSLLASPTLSPGASFSFTFDNAGFFGYHCSIHPMMKGIIVVEN